MPRLTTPTLTPNAPFHTYQRAQARSTTTAPARADYRTGAQRHITVVADVVFGFQDVRRRAVYVPAKASDASRPGRDDALLCPSRRGNRLYYRDGRVTDMEGRPL